MKVPFQPLPDGVPMMTIDEFLQKLQHEPGFAERMLAHYEAQLAQPLNADTEEMHQAARAAYRGLRHHQGMWNVMQVGKRVRELLKKPGCNQNEEAMRQLLAYQEETIDHLLDVMEPERSQYLERFTRYRDELRRCLQNF